MARRRKGRDISGIVVLDKPIGISSNDAVQRAKRLFNARKVGHTGSLDPLASGVLPLCFGEATKFSQYLLASDKRYAVSVKLGVSTDSGDADGQVLETQPVPELSTQDIDAALEAFRGDIDQTPPMFSAIKRNGQPLYKLARQGIEVERESRQVTVFENRLMDFDGETLKLCIHCSKGTYVRTIAQELGAALDCGAHVTALRRTSAGPFNEDEAVTFETLEQRCENACLDESLQPVASAVRSWPLIRLSGATAYYLRQGQPVMVPNAPVSGWVQIVEDDDAFLGVGEIDDDGRVAPRRLVVSG